jgi:hypothetical protein
MYPLALIDINHICISESFQYVRLSDYKHKD